MNVAIFTSHLLLASHYETELEIILKHQKNGDQITQLVCNKELPSCDANPYHQQEACERCVSKRINGYDVLAPGMHVQSFLQLSVEDKKKISSLRTKFSSIQDLQSLWIDNYEIGYSIASSLISLSRNPNPVLEPRLIERYIISCAGVYFSMLNYLRANHTDVVYTFNGRFSHTKAVLRACNKLGVKCLLHERGNSVNYYSLFENTSIHDLMNTHSLIEKAWAEADPEARERIAKDWYTTRIGGKMQNWFSFLADQVIELPEDWDRSKRNIIICNSSEDELASLGDDWKNALYKNQLEGITRIIADGASIENTHFYLRIHPHLAKVANEDVKQVAALKANHLTVIPATSKLSTYHLVKEADKTITFGSTIGMEATFLRKPSICAGKSFYHYLNGTYSPSDHAELMQLLAENLEPKPLEEALKFSYFFGTFGIPFKHYVPEDFDKGTIRGKRIEPTIGKKYRFIKTIYDNKNFPKLSEYLALRKRNKIIQNYLR
jgi:hypothetical protein